MPDFRIIYTAFEVGDIDLCALTECLHEQQFKQDALAAARRPAQQNVRNVCEIDRHRAGVAFAQGQCEIFIGKKAIVPFQHFGQIIPCGNSVHQHIAFTFSILKFDNSDPKCRFNGSLLFLPLLPWNTTISKLPHRNAGISCISVLA